MPNLADLTDNEIIKLAEQIKCSRVIKPILEYAKRFYGPNAAYINLEYENVYNDETYDDRISAIRVYNKNKRELAPNLETPAMFAAFMKHFKPAEGETMDAAVARIRNCDVEYRTRILDEILQQRYFYDEIYKNYHEDLVFNQIISIEKLEAMGKRKR